VKAVILFLSLCLPTAVGQSLPSCPIEFQKVDPHSFPLASGLLGTDKDPWDHYLRIEYKNVTTKTIIAIRFGVAFVDAMAEANKAVYSYNSPEVVKPNKVAKPFWGDGVYFHEYGWRMGAIAWLEKVRFADNTFFVDDGSHSCGFPIPATKLSSPPTAPLSTGSQPTAPKAPNPLIEGLKSNSEAAKSSPAAAASLANAGRIYTPQELAELVKNGQASRCAVVTVPPGAEVEIDGNKGGVSPVAFVLLKQGETPRNITIRMKGYKTVEKQFVPDGKTIPIGITLEKEQEK
jgi:hypothetical protein